MLLGAAQLDHLRGSTDICGERMSDTIRLMTRGLPGKQPVQVHVEEWPQSGALVRPERVGARINIHHAVQPVFDVLQRSRDLVGHADSFGSIPSNSGDDGNAGRTGARLAKAPANDGELIPRWQLDLDYSGHLRHNTILQQRVR